MIYLASPYTHHDPIVREARFEYACKAAAELMRRGNIVFSPIAHSHPVAVHGGIDPNDGAFWKEQDSVYLPMCKEVVVLMIPGWAESRGVQAEIAEAKRLGKPVIHMHPAALGVST